MFAHPLLAALEPEQRRHVVLQCDSRVVKRGEQLLRVGQPCEAVFLLHAGIVRVEMPAREGPACVGFLTAGDLIVEKLSGQSWTAEASYEAVVDATVFKMPTFLLRNLMQAHAEVTSVFVDSCLDRVTKLRRQLRRMQQDSMDSSLGRTLYELSSRSPDGRRIVDKRITQATLADFVGLSREQVNKLMKSLREQGVLDKTEEGYVVSDVFQDTGLTPLA